MCKTWLRDLCGRIYVGKGMTGEGWMVSIKVEGKCRSGKELIVNRSIKFCPGYDKCRNLKRHMCMFMFGKSFIIMNKAVRNHSTEKIIF